VNLHQNKWKENTDILPGHGKLKPSECTLNKRIGNCDFD